MTMYEVIISLTLKTVMKGFFISGIIGLIIALFIFLNDKMPKK